MDLHATHLADPNIGKNRILEKDELSGLRLLSQRIEDSIQDFERKLQEGRQRSSGLLKRYQDLIRAAEAISSEMHAENQFLKTLEVQKTLAESNLVQLRRLTHPIRRCPTDVLQYIFKWVVELKGTETRFIRATVLSHVCRRWRKVALETPRFWKHIEFSIHRSPQRIKAFFDRTVPRVKGIGTIIKVQDIRGEESESKAWECCRFDQLRYIEHLELQLAGEYQYPGTQWNAPRIHPAKSQIRHLYIQSTSKESVVLNIGATVKQFCAGGVQTITLINIDPIPFHENFCERTVSKLHMELDDNRIRLSSFCRAFPNLEDLEIEYDSLEPDNAEDSLWMSLKSLTVASYISSICWPRLHAPALTRFAIPIQLNGSILSFITRTSFLTELDVGFSPGLISVVCKLPNIKRLTTDFNAALGSPSSPKLPPLELLSLRDLRKDSLSIELFDKIVRKHCLHTSTDGRNHHNVNTTLNLLYLYSRTPLEDLKWRRSELFSAAIEKISKTVAWGFSYRAHTLQWV